MKKPPIRRLTLADLAILIAGSALAFNVGQPDHPLTDHAKPGSPGLPSPIDNRSMIAKIVERWDHATDRRAFDDGTACRWIGPDQTFASTRTTFDGRPRRIA